MEYRQTEYARLRDARFPASRTPAFFIAARGGRMARGELNQTFTNLVRQAGLDGRGAPARPRPCDYADLRVMPASGEKSLFSGVTGVNLSA